VTGKPAVLVVVSVLALGAISQGRGDDAPKKDEKLRAELVERAEEDQKARKPLINLQARRGGKDDDAARKGVEATHPPGVSCSTTSHAG
jgi:hypothetical protein